MKHRKPCKDLQPRPDLQDENADDGLWPTAAGQALQADVGFLPEADIHPV